MNFREHGQTIYGRRLPCRGVRLGKVIPEELHDKLGSDVLELMPDKILALDCVRGGWTFTIWFGGDLSDKSAILINNT